MRPLPLFNALASGAVHLLPANRATVDRRPYSEPADGPGALPGPPLAGRNRPAVNIAKLLALLRQVVAAIDDRVRHSGGGCTLSKQTPRSSMRRLLKHSPTQRCDHGSLI
jgi:hypothetical protein